MNEEMFTSCENCDGTGFTHHDCGEDTCCCLYPRDNVVCDVCEGGGGWSSIDDGGSV